MLRWMVAYMLLIFAFVLSGCEGTGAATAMSTPVASGPTQAVAALPTATQVAAAPPTMVPTATTVPAPSATPVPPTQVVAAATPVPPAPTPEPAAQTPCDFVLGFAKMRSQLGEATVGECLENQHEVPGNGTAVQRTEKGTMVYRPQDSTMIFTDGNRTWLDSPRGLVDRPANQRFEWEADRQAIEALRQGGHYIYFRHATTNRSEKDSDPNNLANCTTQRNLADEGRAQARAIGEAFRALNIPVGLVLSSEYCRALEHARLSFEQAQAEPSLVLPEPLTAEEQQRNTDTLLRILGTPPPPGTNVVLVSHSPNIRNAIGVDLPVEGGAVILRPNPNGNPTEVLKILPTEWEELAHALGSR